MQTRDLMISILRILLVACLASCTRAPSEPLPPAAENLRRQLPPTAQLKVYEDLGRWGTVLIIDDDSPDRMAPDLDGETLFGVMHALQSEATRDALTREGYDRIFLCHAAVHIASDGHREADIEVISLGPDEPVPAVLANQTVNVIRRTTATC